MKRNSIRVRLTLWYAAAMVLGLGVFGSLAWLSLRQRLLQELDQDLAGRSARFEQYFRGESVEVAGADQLRDELEEFCQALPPSSYVDLRGSNGFEFHYPDSSAPRTANLRMQRRGFSASGVTFDLELGAPMANLGHVLQLLRLLLLGLLPVVILIASIGGAWLSARALRPIQDITSAARAISIENLSERLPVPATSDELARLTEVLNGMLQRLEAAVKRLSQFAGDASHELRTPLAVIRTTAELALRRPRTPESYRESLSEIVAETGHMTQLVEDLLTVARGGTEASQMPRSPLDLTALLGEVCAALRPVAETRQIRIDAALSSQPMVISGNRAALRRLFVILMDNAIKYSPAGARVRLHLEHQRDGQAAVTIEDSGEGIRDADLPHIFERYYRTNSQSEGPQGYGIGLALADRIARAHGAVIEVNSAPGASVFRVSFASLASANLQIPALS